MNIWNYPDKAARLSRHGVLTLAAAFCLASPCAADKLSLAELFDAARASEPSYLAATSGVRIAEARFRQSRGALLPQVSINGSTHDNNRRYTTRDDFTPLAKDDYNRHSLELSLTQPLFRYANNLGKSQARLLISQAEYQLAAAEQELLSKLGAAWFDLLTARDYADFATRHEATLRRQWEVLRRGRDVGVSGAPQAADAKAKWDQARADLVTAENDIQARRAALEQLTGPLPDRALPVLGGAAPPKIGEKELLAWLARAETDNPSLFAAKLAHEATGLEVAKQRAGHWPTVDLVASYGRNSQATGGFPGQAGYDIGQGSIGFQVNVPVYAGGAQNARVDEAMAQLDRANQEAESIRRATLAVGKQAWYAWRSAEARARAGAQAWRAARIAVDLAEGGIKNGLKTELDVLQAEQQLHAARRDHAKGRYDQLNALLKLKSLAGTLGRADLLAVDTLLVAPNRIAEDAPPPDLSEADSQ